MERPQQQLSPVWKPYAQDAYGLGHRLTLTALGPGRSGGRLDDLARRLQRELDLMIKKAFESLPGIGLACTAGCDYCCRTLQVQVSPVEVFAVSHRLRQAHDGDSVLEERLARLAAADVPPSPDPTVDSSAPMNRGALTPCPLLADGLCAVYSSRPLACRGCVSADASLCAACDDDRPVPRSTAHQLGAAAMAKGLTDALNSLGLAGEPTELRSGLALVLRDEGSEKQWLRGQDVFRQ
jgi:Fe-S-cluster containining protein